MARDNIMAVAGNIADPVLRFTASGKAVLTVGLALNERRNVDGKWENADPSWINVVVWNEQAENAAASLQKGSRVVVIGRFVSRQWEDKQGQTRYSSELVADEIGVSLRWAQTPMIERNQKTAAGPPIEAYDEPPADQGQASYDEEPF